MRKEKLFGRRTVFFSFPEVTVHEVSHLIFVINGEGFIFVIDYVWDIISRFLLFGLYILGCGFLL
jgi:hypothetical protein